MMPHDIMTVVKATETFDVAAVAHRVRELRKKRAIGANQLDRLAGVSNGTTSKFEGGEKREITMQSIVGFARALGTSLDHLCFGYAVSRESMPSELPSDAFPKRASALAAIRDFLAPAVLETVMARRFKDARTKDEWEWLRIAVREQEIFNEDPEAYLSHNATAAAIQKAIGPHSAVSRSGAPPAAAKRVVKTPGRKRQ